jgi:hypothetical protein
MKAILSWGASLLVTCSISGAEAVLVAPCGVMTLRKKP